MSAARATLKKTPAGKTATARIPSRNSRLFAFLGVGVLVFAGLLLFLQLNHPPLVSPVASGKISINQYQIAFAKQTHILLDVRTAEEFAAGHIAGAVNLSLQSLPDNFSRIPKDIPVVLYCRSGNRSNQALQLLQAQGYTNIYDMGGIVDWQAQGLPVTQ